MENHTHMTKKITRICSLLFLCFTLFPRVATAESLAQICKDSTLLESLPVLQEGRLKPYYVNAQESVKFLTQERKFKGMPATEVYCLLSLSQQSQLALTTPIEHEQTQKYLGIGSEKHKTKDFPFQDLLPMETQLRFEMVKAGNNSSYGKDLQKLMQKIALYREIETGQHWTVPSSASGGSVAWIPISHFADSPDLAGTLKQGKDFYISQEGDRYLWELTFAKFNPFSWSLVTVLLSLACFVLFKQLGAGFFFTGLSLLIQGIGIAMRVYISGRAPVTNMYETVMFSGLGACVISCLLTYKRKERIFLMVGLAYNFCCLLMMNFAHSMLNPSISPLVPVLRDNFWLSTHVTMVTLSYASFALSWVLANFVLFRLRFTPQVLKANDLNYYQSLIYSCLKCGVVLLSTGVILGGVWADYSWGRFWGWDPKETLASTPPWPPFSAN